MRPTLLVRLDVFTEMAAEREAAGVWQYRGGDASAPFTCDALAMKLEEHADAFNYLRHAAVQAGHGAEYSAWPEWWQQERRRILESGLWTLRRIQERKAAAQTPRSLDCTA